MVLENFVTYQGYDMCVYMQPWFGRCCFYISHQENCLSKTFKIQEICIKEQTSILLQTV